MGSLVQERCGTGKSQSGLGSKACSAGAHLGSCCDREKRDKSPILQEQQSGESWTGTAQGTYGSEIFFPHISVLSLLGLEPSEEIPHHSHEQVVL